MSKDVVGHREYSSEGKIDPAGIDMDAFRIDVQALIENVTAGDSEMNEDQNNALSAVWQQVGVGHPVRKVFQKIFYNVKDGDMWTRAGLADLWNEMVWDGYVNPVDLADGKDDPDVKPDSKNLARRGSVVSYILGTYRDTALGYRAAQKNTELLEKILANLEGRK